MMMRAVATAAGGDGRHVDADAPLVYLCVNVVVDVGWFGALMNGKNHFPADTTRD